MAQTHSSDQRVQAVGRVLAADHRRLDEEVAVAARKLQVQLPDRPNLNQRNWLAEMTPERGRDFDETFTNRLRTAHGQVFAVVAEVRAGTRNTLSTDGNSTDESLAAAGTTCRAGDLSTYFWPVIRDIRTAGADADQPGGGADGNMGTILAPVQVSLQFRGNAQAKVAAMPRFLRIITGDAKAVTNGPNSPTARAHWTCSGARDKASSDKYPICGRGQLVQRISDFPGCWNGVDTDSPTHRTHTSFADPATGACPAGTTAIPQLRITLGYRVPRAPRTRWTASRSSCARPSPTTTTSRTSCRTG